MLIYRRTNLLESDAQTLVNTVNCVGVMGKGIAKAFKEREPTMFDAYRRICDQRLLEPGKLWLWQGSDQWILNFPTKIHWRSPSKLEWIEAGLSKFVLEYERRGIREISFPRLGCGNGGLDWDNVKPIMEQYLSPLPIPIYIHDFTKDIGLPEHLEQASAKLSDGPQASSFDEFIERISRLVDLADERFVELSSKDPIRAKSINDHGLEIRMGDRQWPVESEDLRGVWVGLQQGLVTVEKAGWNNMPLGGPLLSILGVLPELRPVEIQRGQSEPEIAVELRPKALQPTPLEPPTDQQRSLAWV
ncbi:macro domain-containing protein [Brevundimonas sp.]|uniref:macro domain-containing protein n=1 Tax=Brevundimonas sp. TaxID=1871086 RepID=UPI003918C056